MRDLIETIVRSLVDRPDDVLVEEFDEEGETVIEVTVAADEIGKVIGRQGRTARAMRTLLGTAGMKLRKRFVLEILE